MKPDPTQQKPAAKRVTRIQRYSITQPKECLRLPAGAVLLSHILTQSRIDIYFLCDLTDPTDAGEVRAYHLFETGKDLPDWIWDHAVHVCSVPGFHLFETAGHIG